MKKKKEKKRKRKAELSTKTMQQKRTALQLFLKSFKTQLKKLKKFKVAQEKKREVLIRIKVIFKEACRASSIQPKDVANLEKQFLMCQTNYRNQKYSVRTVHLV